MKLRNNFSIETRYLFEDIGCYECGRRDQRELNHIKGRISASPYNGSILCPECHSHVGHTQEEEEKYLLKTALHLERLGVRKDEFFHKYVLPIMEKNGIMNSNDTDRNSYTAEDNG